MKGKLHAGTQGVWGPHSFVKGGRPFFKLLDHESQRQGRGQHFPLVLNYYFLALLFSISFQSSNPRYFHKKWLYFIFSSLKLMEGWGRVAKGTGSRRSREGVLLLPTWIGGGRCRLRITATRPQIQWLVRMEAYSSRTQWSILQACLPSLGASWLHESFSAIAKEEKGSPLVSPGE